MQIPELPEPDSNGCRSAVENARVLMAQQLIADRQKRACPRLNLPNAQDCDWK